MNSNTSSGTGREGTLNSNSHPNAGHQGNAGNADSPPGGHQEAYQKSGGAPPGQVRQRKERARDILEHGLALDTERAPWDTLHQELADVVHPRRGLVTRRADAGGAPDRDRDAQTYDGTAMRSNRILANGQSARITPMGARWFALRPPEELAGNASATRWYQQCGEVLARRLHASNFYNRAHEHYLDRGAFGTAATEITGGKGGKGLHFRSYDIGSYSITHDEQDEVDTITRLFTRTPKQLLQQYGREALPESVLKKLEDARGSLVPMQVRHTIRPRLDRDPRRTDPSNMPFESVHVLVAEQHVLADHGFNEFPVACSRWELWGNSPYGWPPSLLALPEAIQANFLEQMLDTLAEIAAFPRVLYTASLKGDIDFKALGLTCWDPSLGAGDAMPREWLTGGRYDIGKDRANDKRRAIEEAFYVPLFSSVSRLDRDATATEVRAIVSESRELFHPIFANTIREFLTPVIRRSFSILLRQGELPPPPPSVMRQAELGDFIDDPAVEYTSAMALALEQSQLANFADCINVLSPVAAADPSVFDFLDTDAIGPAFMRYKGLPESFIRTEARIAEIREARAQAQQAQMLQEASGAIRNVGGPQGLQELASLSG